MFETETSPLIDQILTQETTNKCSSQTSITPDIIATPEMQRLKEVKQLGVAFLEYKNATHTRYEHSVGTMGEANALLK